MSDSSRPPPRRTPLAWVGLTALLLGAGALAVWTGTRQVPTAPEPSDLAAIAPASPPAPVPAPPPAAEADRRLRDDGNALSTDPRWRAWLQEVDLLTRLVAALDTLAEGRVPRRPLDFLAPRSRFLTRESSGGEVADPQSFTRYDDFADVLGSIDERRVATAWRALEPLLTGAYRAFGYPQRTIQHAIRPAFVHILSTPVQDGSAGLVAAGGVYRYADPSLEGASDLQKQLWRLGPRNQRIVQQKLRAIALAIGLPAT